MHTRIQWGEISKMLKEKSLPITGLYIHLNNPSKIKEKRDKEIKTAGSNNRPVLQEMFKKNSSGRNDKGQKFFLYKERKNVKERIYESKIKLFIFYLSLSN